MAGVPLKFRCYRCQQLLGVSRSKVGSVVACTKCGADLIVPDPDESSAPDRGELEAPVDAPALSAATRSTQSEGSPGGLETGISLDFLDIRPEDIRVQPGLHSVQVPPYASAEPASPAASPMVMPDMAERSAPVAHAEPVSIIIEEPPPRAAAPPEIAREAPPPVAAPIRIEVPRERRKDILIAASSRSRDMTLPRSVVAAWSLFVILGLGFAFLAGLLAGHYVWRVH